MQPLAGCDTVKDAEHAVGLGGSGSSEPTMETRYLGEITADDPAAVDLGRRVLLGGGNAADTAASIALTLTVTQPGRAGLDGGGVCLVKPPGAGAVEELDFLPKPAQGGNVPVPGLVRGLAALQARFGAMRWQQIVAPVEALATTGMTVTPSLLSDLQTAGLGTAGPGGRELQVGDVVPQRAVATTLGELRVGGPNEFYTGNQGSELVSAGVPPQGLASYAPVWRSPASLSAGGVRLYYPQGPGGAAVQAAWAAAQNAGDPAGSFAASRAAAYQGGGAGLDQPLGSTAFLVADGSGRAVSCAIGMGKPFGAGQTLEPLGIFAAMPFEPAAEASLVPMLAVNDRGDQLIGGFAGAGSFAAPADTASVAAEVLRRNRSVAEAVADPRTQSESVGTLVSDRIAALSCPGGLPEHPGSCAIQNDPRGGGYAMRVDQLVRR